jgi:tRNA (guanosine-2'-O-)-methyltransferase
MAFIFGTEYSGISPELKALADHSVHIPMNGFTESFNISVSVAIILQTLRLKIQESPKFFIGLSENEKQEITLDWYKKIVKNSDLILKRLQL